MYKLLYMDIYNSYKAGKAHHKEMENVNKNNKYFKKHEKSYEDIRSHVLETAETKTNCQAQVVGNLQKKKVNINV